LFSEDGLVRFVYVISQTDLGGSVCVLGTSTKKTPDSERLSNFHHSFGVKEGLEVGNRLEYAMKSLLQMSGYSDKAAHEIMKWYKPKRESSQQLA